MTYTLSPYRVYLLVFVRCHERMNAAVLYVELELEKKMTKKRENSNKKSDIRVNALENAIANLPVISHVIDCEMQNACTNAMRCT